jgi:hypothetical protein
VGQAQTFSGSLAPHSLFRTTPYLQVLMTCRLSRDRDDHEPDATLIRGSREDPIREKSGRALGE